MMGFDSASSGITASSNSNSKSKTFRTKPNVQEGTRQKELLQYVEHTLKVAGDVRQAVRLPSSGSISLVEWHGIHASKFHQETGLFIETIEQFCTPDECPVMNAGEKYEYHWCDGAAYKKPICIPALEYMNNLMHWANDKLENLSSQPPTSRLDSFKVIFKRLFRVYAHIYYAHFHQVVQLELEAHFNTSFRHFMFFVQEFSLISPKELAPLAQLAEKLCK